MKTMQSFRSAPILVLAVVAILTSSAHADGEKYLGTLDWKIVKNGNLTSTTEFPCAETAYVDLSDPDIEGAGSVALAVTSTTGDAETITLLEIGGITGVFRGSMQLQPSAVQVGNGTLETVHGGEIRVEYLDLFNDQGGEQLISKTAVTQCPAGCGDPPKIVVPEEIPDAPLEPICAGCVTEFKVRITNIGCQTLQGEAVIAAPFFITAGAAYVIEPSDPPRMHEITVQFRPTDPGVATRVMSFSGDGIVTREVTAEALGTAPAIQVAPTMIDFGSVDLGQTAQQTITITNGGCGAVTGTATVSPPFYITAGADYDVSCGAEARVTVEFRPEIYGPYDGVVVLTGGGGAEVPVQGYGQGKRDFVHLVNVGPQPSGAFPVIKADVIVDTSAGQACELLERDFVVIEDGMEQEIASFSCGQTVAADIVVLFDDSGSISPIMRQMMDHVHTLVDAIQADTEFAARFGIMRITASPPSVWEPLTSDIDLFHQRLEALGNGLATELVADGIINGLRDMDFLPGVGKIFLVITDEPSQGTNYATAQQKVIDAGGSVYVMSIVDAQLQSLATNTGGLFQDIASPDMLGLYTHMRQKALGIYSLTYTTRHYCADGVSGMSVWPSPIRYKESTTTATTMRRRTPLVYHSSPWWRTPQPSPSRSPRRSTSRRLGRSIAP
jgi:hypothetical protein